MKKIYKKIPPRLVQAFEYFVPPKMRDLARSYIPASVTDLLQTWIRKYININLYIFYSILKIMTNFYDILKKCIYFVLNIYAACLFLPFKISYVVAGVVLMVVYKAADRVLCTLPGGKTIKNFLL
jgi:ABC-type sulfate transport system permease subunit